MTSNHLIPNTLLVWLDVHTDENRQDIIAQLLCTVNTVERFTNADECIDHLTDVSNENVFVLITDALSRTIIPLIHEVTQLGSIFILMDDNANNEQWSKEWTKVKGVFAETSFLCNAIDKVSQQTEKNAISFSLFSPDDCSSRSNLDKLDQSFMYTQILKEVLLTIDFEDHHMKEFIAYCRQLFINNSFQLDRIKNFEENYRCWTPISVYTQEIFLHSMLNRALRKIDVDVIMKMSFFICDLHRHIKELYKRQFGAHHLIKPLVVYRGQCLSAKDFNHIVKTRGGLISFNNFLSTSECRGVALPFAEIDQANSDQVGILFVMTIEPAKSKVPFAKIRAISRFTDEDEVLFSMHTIFRIREITAIDPRKRLWQVDLTFTDDSDKDLRILTQYIRKGTHPKAEGWTRLGLVLMKMGEVQKAEQIYTVLLKNTKRNFKKAIFYQYLGLIKQTQRNYSEAIVLYESSLEYMQNVLPPNHPDLAVLYNDIGSIHHQTGNYLEAISFYRKALQIQQEVLPADHPHLAFSYNNIALAYFHINEYSDAIFYFEIALKIQQKILPSNHPDLATSNHNIGSAYQALGRHRKALAFYEIALNIRQEVLLPNHPDLIISYKNISSVYRMMGEQSKANLYYQKSREIK